MSVFHYDESTPLTTHNCTWSRSL